MPTWIVEKGTGNLIPKEDYVPAHQRGEGLQIIGDIEPYKSIMTGEIIGGRKAHRDHLRAHGVRELGNDKIPPKKPYEPQGVGESIKTAMQKLGMDV